MPKLALFEMEAGMLEIMSVAAVLGQGDVVRLLVEQGADVNRTPDYLGYTPLILATACCSPTTVQFLIEHGADLHSMSDDKMTPLRCAEKYGRSEIVALLKAAGASE